MKYLVKILGIWSTEENKGISVHSTGLDIQNLNFIGIFDIRKLAINTKIVKDAISAGIRKLREVMGEDEAKEFAKGFV